MNSTIWQILKGMLQTCLIVFFITKSFLTYSFFPPTLALSTISRPLSSSMCSITPETANVCSSYNRMQGPCIGCSFSDRSKCSHWSYKATVLLMNPNIYTDQWEPIVMYHSITFTFLLVLIQLCMSLESNAIYHWPSARLESILKPLLHLYRMVLHHSYTAFIKTRGNPSYLVWLKECDVFSCLSLSGMDQNKPPRTCLWLLSKLVVIVLYNVSEEYVCAKCEMDIHIYWEKNNVLKLPKTQTKQHQIKQHKMRQHPDKKVKNTVCHFHHSGHQSTISNCNFRNIGLKYISWILNWQFI